MHQDRHQDGHDAASYQRIEVITGERRRRSWSDAEKARIVAESADPETSISEVARRIWAHATDDRAWKGPAPPAVAYVFAGGRGKKEIVAQLAGFEGVLQVDGYAAYASLAGDAMMSGQIQLAYCLVHARRNFVRVHKTTNSPFAAEVIERIAAVYAIEGKRYERPTEPRTWCGRPTHRA
ncbi:transposase [Bradyrhizobium japonicum USDA 135]|nr:transposase [Bradyrhizobium japonicum USDA 135]